MRSDRNPYYILKASKKPDVQKWLALAPTLTEEEITALAIKPDLKKAMLYGREKAHAEQAASLAENLADVMNVGFQPHHQIFEIYQYQGPTRWFSVSAISSVEIRPLTYWGLDQDNMFVNHCFVKTQDNPWILEDSEWHTQGTSSTINHLNASKHITSHVS